MRLLTVFAMLLFSPCISSQQLTTPSLIRYIKNDSIFKIPLTQFCIIENAGFSDEYNSGWFMKWDIKQKSDTSLLLIEMNSTDVEGWLGNNDISGSFQLAIELPNFRDSIVIFFDKRNKAKYSYINNYSGVTEHIGIQGSVELKKGGTNIDISRNLILTTRRAKTKQGLRLFMNTIPVYNLSSWSSLMDKIDKKREKEKDEFVNALTTAIVTRDSIWEENKKKAANLPKELFTGSFRFWISDINKPSYSRTTYYVTEDSIVIKKGPYDFIYFSKNYSKDVVSVAKKLPNKYKQALIDLGQKIRTDSLESSYNNFCMMDGLILSFHFEWPDLEKGITVSNYYLGIIDKLLMFLNTIVPKKYILNYPKESLIKHQQECEINKKIRL